MGENTKIEWCSTRIDETRSVQGHTFNGWIGCTKVSDGCTHCYAEALMDKRLGSVNWGKGKARKKTSAAYWRKPLLWNEKAKKLGVRVKVFCSSLADVFDDEVDQSWRDELWELMERTPDLDWLVLTKRPGNVAGMVPTTWMKGFPSNIWMGTSVENQKQADIRVPLLLDLPVVVR